MAVSDREKKDVAMVTVTIDGKEISVPEGTNLIQAAEQLGIEIPHYCYHPSLSIDGSCRLCLVEIEGIPKLTIACNTEIRDGMVVHTDTPVVEESRKGMMEFLLVNHPLDCPVCDRGGECQLQRYSMDYGFGDARTRDQRRKYPKEQFDPMIDLERNRCILCSRCVRFMDEIGGEHLIGIHSRGSDDYIGTYNNQPVSTNIFAGNIVDLCPVGALTSKPYRFKARPWELQQVQGTCTLCPTGCRVTYWMRAGNVYRTTPPTRPAPQHYKLNEDTQEFICDAGRYGNDFGNNEERLADARVDGRRVFWDKALDAAASRLAELKSEHGAESIGFVVSPNASTEEMYLLNRLARAHVGTNNIDWRGDLINPASATAWTEAIAHANGQLENPDLYDTIILINADIYAQAPVSALKLKEAAKLGHSKVITIGFRHDEWFGSRTSLTLTTNPDQSVEIIEIIGGLIKDPQEDVDEKAKRRLVELTSGSVEEVDALIETIKETGSGLLLYGLSELNGLNAERIVNAVLNTAGTTEAWDALPLIAERNYRGAFEVGCQPDLLPGGFIDDPYAIQRINDYWKCTISEKPGYNFVEMLEAAADGRLRALYVYGADVFKYFPDPELLERALDNLDLLIVQDYFPSGISRKAHVVLPSTVFCEGEGTYADLSGNVTRVQRGMDPLTGTRTGLSILSSVIYYLTNDELSDDPAQVFKDMIETIEILAPTDYNLLSPKGPGPEAPIRRYEDPEHGIRPLDPLRRTHVSTFDPLCRFLPKLSQMDREPQKLNRSTLIEKGANLSLTWGPHLLAADPRLDRSQSLGPIRRPARIELHPQTAESLGLADGDTVIVGEGGEGLRGVLKLNEYVAKDVVYIPQNMFDFSLAADIRALPSVQVSKAES